MDQRRRAFQPPPNLKGVFVGSGSDGMSDPRIAKIIVDLTGKATAPDVTVVYLGTATYDLPAFQTRQTQCFADLGCTVTSLPLVNATVPDTMPEIIESADVIVVGGGNTLFALDRWHRMGLVRPHLERARDRGCVLTGGSAGAICWFDGGHSDSMDPDTYQMAMMEKHHTTTITGKSSSTIIQVQDESSVAPDETDIQKSWKSIRVPGLGFLPGLLCPHHDRMQSNGVLRAHDFDKFLLRRQIGDRH
jgi:dipeptidase E